MARSADFHHIQSLQSKMDKLKGHASVNLDNRTGELWLDHEFTYRLKFKAWDEKKKLFQGHCLMSKITQEVLENEVNNFDIEVTWLNQKSP